jgi:DNA-binding response OmpR family regulator
MTAAMKTTIVPITQDSNSAFFLDEVLASVQGNRISEEYRKLSGFLPVLVLITKSAVYQKINAKTSVPDQAAERINGNWVIPLRPATARLENPMAKDTFAFGQMTVNFSTMETHRKGQPVTLTRKEFKTLSYLIKNARRVISREELLKEVWGYHCYPCTRTVDNHILRLRQKLESEPTHPKHFLTIHGTGYKFLP